LAGWTRNIFFKVWRIQTMPGVKQTSKRKRTTKAVPVLGAAGLTFSLVSGASAAVAPVTDVSLTPNIAPGHEFTLGVEELSDVSLATFYAFDKENTGSLRGMVQEARGCGGSPRLRRSRLRRSRLRRQRLQRLRRSRLRLRRWLRLRRRRLLPVLGRLPPLLNQRIR
jgi:hypothetical protein